MPGRAPAASVRRTAATARRAARGEEEAAEAIVGDAILERVARGEADAVRQCLDRYSGLVWSLARRLTREPADAEDAVQDIFISLWQSAHRYDPAKASESTFIAMIARRRLIDRLRSKSRGDQYELVGVEEVENAVSVAPRAEAKADVARVATALEQLRPDQRKVLELSIAHGLSHQQISASTGISLGTVKSHVRRGLIRIREILSDEEPGDSEEST